MSAGTSSTESLSGVEELSARSLFSSGLEGSCSVILDVSTLLLQEGAGSVGPLQREEDSVLGGREITPSVSS